MNILKDDMVALTLEYQRFISKKNNPDDEYNMILSRLGFMITRLSQMNNRFNNEITTLQDCVQTPSIRGEIKSIQRTQDLWLHPSIDEWKRRVATIAGQH